MLRLPMAAAPSPALAPPPGNPRFPLLDAMRAFAALAIVMTHVSGVTNFNSDNPLGAYTARLNFGVTLFFLLSGFLLYRPFVAARLEGRPPIRIRDYTRRRVLRIVPAYWVALTVLALWPGLVAFWDGPWWRSYTFTQIYWGESTVQGIFPAWTLCIEVSFYLALPFLAAAIGRIAGRRAGVELALLAALGTASVVVRTALEAAGGSFVLQNTLVCYLGWFCIGMAFAVVSVAWRGRERETPVLRLVADRPWVPWALAAVAFWFVATQMGLPRGFFLVYDDISYLGEHLMYALCAALLLLPAVFGDAAGGWVRRLLSWRLLGWLGLISYGIFLWHGPLVLWLSERGADGWIPGSGYLSMLSIAVAMSVVCAAASYYLVERPALGFKDRRRRSAERASAPDATAASARQAAGLSGSASTASRASGSA
jgi:peptidoglycan/LPS O-acetylase OafA/YrhL